MERLESGSSINDSSGSPSCSKCQPHCQGKTSCLVIVQENVSGGFYLYSHVGTFHVIKLLIRVLH